MVSGRGTVLGIQSPKGEFIPLRGSGVDGDKILVDVDDLVEALRDLNTKMDTLIEAVEAITSRR